MPGGGYPAPVPRRLSGWLYDVGMGPLERAGLRVQRAVLLAGATGRVLEVGAGTGLSLPHYRTGAVTEVVAAEPDPAMRVRLVRRAGRAAVPVVIRAGGLPGLGEPPGSFDTIVCLLVLCSVADVAATLAELRALLAPGGQLLFFEHVLGRPPLSSLQRCLAPAWAAVAAGCRLDRDTVGALRSAGFAVTDLEKPAPLGRLTAGSIVRGRAVARPAAGLAPHDPPG